MCKKLYFQFKRDTFKNIFNEEDIINILNKRYTINGENLLISNINNKINHINTNEELINLFDFQIIGREDDDGYPYLRLFARKNYRTI